MKYEKLVEKIRKYTEKSVKKSRYEHSVRVADMCVRICKHYGFDEKQCENLRLMALLHELTH